MAYIHRHGEQWRAQVAKRGVRKTSVWPTKREAQEWAAMVESEIQSNKLKASSGKTIQDAADKYLKTVSIHKRDAVEWERRRFATFVDAIGNLPLEEVTSEKLGIWRDERLKTVSGSTVVREVNLYRNLFRVARDEWKWITESPFTGVRLPKSNPPRQSTWTWQLIKRLLRAPTTGKTREVVEAFHIALRTGMRLQEVLAAPQNFDAKRQIVTVKTKGAEKGEEIPIGRIGAKLLKRKPFTVSPNEASTLFSRLCKAQMIEGLTFHDARATALTLLAKKVDVFKLARISRHKDINLLHRVYYRTTNDEIARLI